MYEEKPHVLYVEDQADTRTLITFMLDMSGLVVTAVERARDGLQQLDLHHFDLVLLDNALPDVSGCNLCRVIREFDKEVPILFYSACDLPDEIERAIDAGADGYQIKPTDTDHLPHRIWRLIIERRMNDE